MLMLKRFRGLFLFLGVVSACGIASATAVSIGAGAPQATGTVESGWGISGDFQRLLGQPSRAWAAGSSSDLVAVDAGIDVAAAGGEMAITATETFAAADAIGAVTACAVSVVCAVGVAAVGLGALALARTTKDASGKSFSFDEGMVPSHNGQWLWDAGGGCAPQPTIYAAGVCTAPGWVATGLKCEANGTNLDGSQYGDCSDSIGRGFHLSQSLHDGLGCPPVQGVIVNPSYDHKCPGGPIAAGLLPAAAAATLVAAGFDLGSPGMSHAAQQAIDADSAANADVQLSGPATQTGQPTTTTTVDTSPTGEQQTTQTQTTPSYKNDYDGNQLKQTPNGETTTTTHPDGSSSTSTTVVPVPPTDTNTGTGTSGTGTGGATTNPDLCAEHPGIVACDTLGTPDGGDPTWGTKNVTFAPEDIGMPSGCPAPRTFTVRAINFTLNYQPACDIAPIISAGLVAFCALGCALWIVSVVKA